MTISLQDDLFTGCRWLERTTSRGVVVRVRLEPLSRGRVRILRYERKRPGESAFTRRHEEEGRTLALEAVAPEEDYERLFGFSPPASSRARGR